MLLDIHEALLNFGDIYAHLWPEDDTPRILMRVLIHFNYGAVVRGSEADRCKLILDFCDSVLRDNACRALVKDPPLSFRRTKEKWGDLADRQSAAVSRYQGSNQGQDGRNQSNKSNAASGAASNRGGPGAQGGRNGNQFKGKVARLTVGGASFAVCFDYNKISGCTRRQAKGCGCDDGKGGVFAHACNFLDTSTGKWCLAIHPRHSNH